jgi:hypothetical protein
MPKSPLYIYQPTEYLADVSPRFSKLFMSHLDAEFQKQSIPTLRSLIADQVGCCSFFDAPFLKVA